jgi:hypothetical protein
MNYEDLNEEELIIKQGATKAYQQNIYFTGNNTNFQSRIIESLIVINIAQSLLEWAIKNNLCINLEYPIKHFYNGAFPKMIWTKRVTSNPSKFLRRIEHNPKFNKSGRIDIVITKEPKTDVDGIYLKPSSKSLFGIEIKSINNSIKDIKIDFLRMSYAVALQDDLTTNSIQAGYCLFYRRLDNPKKIYTEDEIEKIKVDDLLRWNQIFVDILPHKQNIQFKNKQIVISEDSFEKLKGYYPPEEFDANEIAELTGLVVCYLVKITRK